MIVTYQSNAFKAMRKYELQLPNYRQEDFSQDVYLKENYYKKRLSHFSVIKEGKFIMAAIPMASFKWFILREHYGHEVVGGLLEEWILCFVRGMFE